MMDRTPLDAGRIAAAIAEGATVGQPLHLLEQVDSTNTRLKTLAREGAPDGMTILAEEQTAGRGRRERQFVSLRGSGLYLSVLLRPRCTPEQALDLTSWTAVAACDAIEAACGRRPGIKWTNDLILGNKKLGGILCEMGIGAGNTVDHVVIGIGLNVSHSREELVRAGLGDIATSLTLEGCAPSREQLAIHLLQALDRMYRDFPAQHQTYLDRCRRDCVTLGRAVTLLRPQGTEEGVAESIDDRFRLVVHRPDGSAETVSSGEVSVRGISGYL